MADGLTLSKLRVAMPMGMIVCMLIPTGMRLAPGEQKLLALHNLCEALGRAVEG
jgi:hypothetical protein